MVETAQRLAEIGDSWPPYDIEKHGEDNYRITMAVAGFDRSELAIEQQDNALTVSGRKAQQAEGVSYLYRGIAPQSFSRTFQLADWVKVTGANLADGVLTIDLVREVPEELKPRRIEIGNSKPNLMQRAKRLIEGKPEKAA
jgi:molecular chaperone IbpA